MTKQLSENEWSVAENLGNIINTENDPEGIFIHQNEKKMYFSSNRHNSIGGYDMFYSKLDKNGKWSKTINMGYLVNTTDNNLFFVISTDGKKRLLFITPKRLFWWKRHLPSIIIKWKHITLLTGTIERRGEESLPKNTLITITRKGSTDTPLILYPRKKDGNFSATLQAKSQYQITYIADN